MRKKDHCCPSHPVLPPSCWHYGWGWELKAVTSCQNTSATLLHLLLIDFCYTVTSGVWPVEMSTLVSKFWALRCWLNFFPEVIEYWMNILYLQQDHWLLFGKLCFAFCSLELQWLQHSVFLWNPKWLTTWHTWWWTSLRKGNCSKL